MSETDLSRPRTMAGFLAASSNFATRDGVARGLAFRPRASDVFISPYAKCGTTWMQQIVHGLRTGGDMTFSEITEVVPWIELAHDLGLDPEASQPASPRAYKSHLTWEEIPKGGRYIVVFRDPVDAFASFYRFMDGWFFERGSITPADFAEYYLTRPEEESYWGHAASWWAVRDRSDVLATSFEEMKADIGAVVARVARFIGQDERAAIDIATRQARFDFMKAHAGQFDDHIVRHARDAACGLPAGGDVTKVSRGEVGGQTSLVNEAMRAAFAAKWRETMGEQFGLADYAQLRAALE